MRNVRAYTLVSRPDDLLVSAVTVDPTAAATSFASNGSMLAEHQRQKPRKPMFLEVF